MKGGATQTWKGGVTKLPTRKGGVTKVPTRKGGATRVPTRKGGESILPKMAACPTRRAWSHMWA